MAPHSAPSLVRNVQRWSHPLYNCLQPRERRCTRGKKQHEQQSELGSWSAAACFQPDTTSSDCDFEPSLTMRTCDDNLRRFNHAGVNLKLPAWNTDRGQIRPQTPLSSVILAAMLSLLVPACRQRHHSSPHQPSVGWATRTRLLRKMWLDYCR